MLGSVVAAAAAGHLLMTMCRGSPTRLADLENGPLTVLGDAKDSRCLPTTLHKTQTKDLVESEDA